MTGLVLSALVLFVLFAAVAGTVWQEQRRTRRIRESILARRARPEGRAIPIVYRSQEWERAADPEAVGLLFVEDASAALAVSSLPPATTGSPVPEILLLPGKARVVGLQLRKHVWVELDVEGTKHFIAGETGVLILGSEERAHELASLLAKALAAPDAPPEPEAGERPVLVIGRRGPVELWRIPSPLIWFTALVGAGALAYQSLLEGNAWYEWLPPTELVFATIVPATFVTGLFARRYLRRRWARAEFFPDRVVFTRERPVVVPLAALAGFRDDSSEYVQLVRRTDRIADPDLSVPTRTEDERVQVLRFLDEHGVRRHDPTTSLGDLAGGA